MIILLISALSLELGNWRKVTTDLEAIAHRVLDEISSPFLLDGQSCDLGITIGICMAYESGESMKTLIHRADTALYKGKEAGRNCYRFG